MSRYLLMQDQLDALLGQIRHLSRLSEAKDERIKDLERYRVPVFGAENEKLLQSIGKMEDEIRGLKILNKELGNEKINNLQKINVLETLLNEERKLREYYEIFAKETEFQYAEESVIKELTTQLCQLQKDEIEIENKKILELQMKIRKLQKKLSISKGKYQKKSEKYFEESGIENYEKDAQLKAVIHNLRNQLINNYGDLKNNSLISTENLNYWVKLALWMKGIGVIMQDLNDIQQLKKDLNQLKSEIVEHKKIEEKLHL